MTPDAVTAQAPMLPRPFRVARNTRELADIHTLVLEPADGAPIAPPRPGQFNMLYAFGVGESAISLSGDPADAARVVHTIRAVGAVTEALCAARAGELVGVRGPFGAPWPIEAATGGDVLVVAGGVGLAPLRPVLYALLAQRARYGRVTLLCGARSPTSILYRRELERLAARAGLAVEITVDHASPDWPGPVGVVTQLIARAQLDPARTLAMICGPEVMMRFAARELASRGVPGDAIFLSLERNMKCAIGLCGHCQFGRHFVCKDGPVFRYARVQHLLSIRQV